MRFTSIAYLATFVLWGPLIDDVRPETLLVETRLESRSLESLAVVANIESLTVPAEVIPTLTGSKARSPKNPEAPSMEPQATPQRDAESQDTKVPDSKHYASSSRNGWNVNAFDWRESPIDLSFLNAKERPAGRHGILKADRDQLVFQDGTSTKFWGANIIADTLFRTPRQDIARQAHRISMLGFNVIRIQQHDADWAKPNIFVDSGVHDTRHLDPKMLELLDWWIKCLKDEGIYIWLDLVWNRALTVGDGVTVAFDEIRQNKGYVWGFNYFNEDVRALMQEFQHNFLNHMNRHTRMAYKDDPAVVGMQLTNENDMTHHLGNMLHTNTKNPKHNSLFMKELRSFAKQTGLPENRLWRVWEPGPSKLFLNEIEHRFNRFMIDDLRKLGTRALVSTTSTWGECPISSLPALTEGDIIEVHSYGRADQLSANLREQPTLLTWIGAAQVQGKPLAITEWNLNDTTDPDRSTVPLYLASIASLQGWDMPMISVYSIRGLQSTTKNSPVANFEIYADPAIGGLMPAAAIAFRRGHISPARKNYCLSLSREQLFNQDLNPKTCATIRTLIEQSRVTIGLPAVKELPWLVPSDAGKSTVITDPNHDYIPVGQSFARSDTGELMHSWKYGIQTINTPRTQAISGWVGGKPLQLADTTIRAENANAVVALTSLDDEPLLSSRNILITTLARAVTDSRGRMPYWSEPVVATINLRFKTSGLQLLALGSNGTIAERVALKDGPQGLTVELPTRRGTHWYLLKAEGASTSSK